MSQCPVCFKEITSIGCACAYKDNPLFPSGFYDKDFRIKQLEAKISEAVAVLKDSEHKAPTCRAQKALEILERP